MPDVRFRVDAVEAVPFAAAPQLAVRLRVTNQPSNELIRSISLACQVRIDPTARGYTAGERDRLVELFGEPSRWGLTVRGMLWANVTALVPEFTAEGVAELHLPCTFDFNVAATKYFYGLETGDVAVSLLFSGTVFYERPDGAFQVAQIPWDREAPFRLPVTTWRAMMDHYYPDTAWLCLPRDVFDRLARYKAANGLATWDAVVDRLLGARDRPDRRDGGNGR